MKVRGKSRQKAKHVAHVNPLFSSDEESEQMGRFMMRNVGRMGNNTGKWGGL